MKESILKIKSKEFALTIIAFCRELKANHIEAVLVNQLLKSGTSIGANIHEAFFAHGRAVFISKLQIALKECSETEYWIELISESGFKLHNNILNDCIELKRILISSINSTKNSSSNS